MHRSVLLLLMSALLLSVTVGLPLSLEESDEMSWHVHDNAINKSAAKDSSSSSEEHKFSASTLHELTLQDLREIICNGPDAENLNLCKKVDSIEESMNAGRTIHKRAAKDPTAAGKRGLTLVELREIICFDADPEIPEVDPSLVREIKKMFCPPDFSSADAIEESTNAGRTIHKRAAKDPSSSSEEHKTAAIKRVLTLLVLSETLCVDADPELPEVDPSLVRELKKRFCPPDFSSAAAIEESMNAGSTIQKRAAKDPSSSSEEHKDKAKDSSGESSSEEHKTTTQAPVRRRRSEGKAYITEQEQQRINKASGELDAQAEKELDEEMARAVADVKDNGSIEDYAQGCEVMEVSSKEANEATYAE